MKIFLFTIGLFLCSVLAAQQDTIVVTDYTKVMVQTDSEGNLDPITTLEIKQAGFFLSEVPSGTLRICTPSELFVWINGKLIDVIDECTFYEPEAFFQLSKSDTIFVSFSSNSSLIDLSCDLVVFEELLVIKEQKSLPRNIRNQFKEFVIISLIAILILFGVVISSFPSRISYLLEKSFTLKASAYEFVNTGFFTGASMYMLMLYSLSLAFVGLYLDTILQYGLFSPSEGLAAFLMNWLKIATGIFILFVIKWLVISIIAGLFKFRDLKNYQLFDFLNFNMVLLAPTLIFLLLDFVLNDFSKTWISSGFMMLFPIMLILFVIWFTLKFVNNSSRKKLSIISYLCATEIIPVIILMGWFFK